MSGLWLKITFCVSSLWCVFGFGILLSWDFFQDFDPPTSFVVLLMIAVLGGFVRFLLGRRHKGKLVFWCRRFGDTEALAGQLNRWHGRIIDEATKGEFLPVTLQDESVDMPPLVGSAAVIPLFILMMPGSIGSTLWLFELSWFDTSLGKVMAFVIVILAVTAPSIIAIMVARWLGTRKVVPGSVARTARRALLGRRSHTGMLILQCKTQHWQACVSELLDLVIFAIIDVSVLSNNVEWEVETAKKHLGPHNLLLIQAKEKLKELVECSQENNGTILRYDMSRAVDELNTFSQSWREEKHQLTDPDASLGQVGLTIANTIKEWMRYPQ